MSGSDGRTSLSFGQRKMAGLLKKVGVEVMLFGDERQQEVVSAAAAAWRRIIA